jgi:hypothetical protein
MRRFFAVFAAIALCSVAVADPPGTPENSGANQSVSRWAKGRFEYRTLKDKRLRGSESFHMTMHPDGTRSLSMWYDLFARNSQFTVVLRSDREFRPLEGYVSYWTNGAFKGSTVITVRGASLRAATRGPNGLLSHELTVPARFSLGTHPVSGDGWHTWPDSVTASGVQESTIYSMEASADLTKPALGRLNPLTFERIGNERITVPAGTFDTVHYRLQGFSDIWITLPDRIMIRMISERADRDYSLVEFTTS